MKKQGKKVLNKDVEEDQQSNKGLKCKECDKEISGSPYGILSDFLIRGKIVCDECFKREKNVLL